MKSGNSIVRFGPFELNPLSGELRKHGIRIKLQGRPLQVLQALLEEPGEVVTRDELQQRLWPADSVVDFENGLNTAIKRLRTALGDSAETPLYVETIARTGYRFVAPVAVRLSPPEAIRKPEPIPYRPRWIWPATAVAFFLGALCMWAYGHWDAPDQVRFRQVTFRRGQVWSARFAPDGQSILYAAQWDGGGKEIFSTSGVSPESRQLGMPDATLAAVSRHGELALHKYDGTMPVGGGSIFTVPMNGGAPRLIESGVFATDFAPDGQRLALVRLAGGVSLLEFPSGRVLFKTPGWLSNPRVSPDGSWIAFIHHPVRHHDAGFIKIVTLEGREVATSPQWSSVGGLSWHDSGKEVWVTAAASESPRSLWSFGINGRLKSVLSAPGALNLHDLRGNRALLSRASQRLELSVSWGGDTGERTISWLDWSRVADLSADGRHVLFDESGEATGGRIITYLYSGETGQMVRLGEGVAQAIRSGDNLEQSSALLLDDRDRTRLALAPLSGGAARPLPSSGLEYQWVKFLPDGEHLLALASRPGESLHLYRHHINGRGVRQLSPPLMTRNAAISPEGQDVAVLTGEGQLVIYPTQAGSSRVIATAEKLAPVHWGHNGKLYVQHMGRYTDIPARVSRLDLTTRRLEPWREFGPADRVGINNVTRIVIAADERSCAYNYRRVLSDLFLAEWPSHRF